MLLFKQCRFWCASFTKDATSCYWSWKECWECARPSS